MKGRTARQKMRFPVSKHGADFGRELTVELVSKDVLNAAFREQVLLPRDGERERVLLTPKSHQPGC